MPSPKLPRLLDEKELLRKVSEGDERAFETIYHAYAKKIYLFAFKILQSELAAEEVVREVMLKLWNIRHTLRDVNNLESYLRVWSRNLSLNAIRRRETDIKASMVLKDSTELYHNETEERVMLNEAREILNKAIEQLPPQQREVYRLCHQQGLKYQEVAQQLQLSRLTVATHMKLALRFLRIYLQKHSDLTIIWIIFKLF